MSSPVTVSAGLALELYFVRRALDTLSQHGRARETLLALLSVLEACLKEALEFTLISVDPQLWFPIQHQEEKIDPWPKLAATITDPESDEIIAEGAFLELSHRLRFLAAKLKGKYKWDIFDDPNNRILFGFKINFDQNDRIHIKIGGQWSVKIWEIDLDENFSEMAGIREQLRFVAWKSETINGKIIEADRELPYSMSLNWLVDGVDSDLIGSFDVTGAGIRKTLSLQNETYREEDRVFIKEEVTRISKTRERERERETTRGVMVTDNEEIEISKAAALAKKNRHEEERRARKERERRAKEWVRLNGNLPLP